VLFKQSLVVFNGHHSAQSSVVAASTCFVDIMAYNMILPQYSFVNLVEFSFLEHELQALLSLAKA